LRRRIGAKEQNQIADIFGIDKLVAWLFLAEQFYGRGCIVGFIRRTNGVNLLLYKRGQNRMALT